MTTQEFSAEFDILYNNLASNAAPPINAYEKSVFLTKAQSDIVIELYSGRNNLGLSFESNEEVREYLRPLIKQSEWSQITTPSDIYPGINCYGVSITRTTDNNKNPVLFTIKEEIRETYTNTDKSTYTIAYPVIPATQDTIHSILNNPFKGPKSGKRAIRLDDSENKIYLYFEKEPKNTWKYRETYLTHPSSIIIYEEGMNGLFVGYDKVGDSEQQCTLPLSLHRLILERAVLLAKMAYVGGQSQPQQTQE